MQQVYHLHSQPLLLPIMTASLQAGELYHDKLLKLPGFLLGQQVKSTEDILDGFKLTGHFLERHIFEPRGLDMPEQRQRMLADLAQRTH